VRALGRVVVAVVATGSLAVADVPPPKGPPPDLTFDQLEDWARAASETRHGENGYAVTTYNLMRGSRPLPNVSFNIARLFLLADDVSAATSNFEQYLKEAPDAPDAAQIKALLADLAKRPQFTTVGTLKQSDEDVEATIFVDGDKLGPSPQRFPADGKPHSVLRIGRKQFVTSNVERETRSRYVSSDGGTREKGKGNVYIDFYGTTIEAEKLGGAALAANTLITIPPGRYKTSFGKSEGNDMLCAPVDIEVKPGAQLTYVFVGATSGQHGHYGCWDVEKLRMQYIPWEGK
jgi:hypothetical protein